MPHLSIAWETAHNLNLNESARSLIQKINSNHVNLYPPVNVLIKAIIDLIEAYKWEAATAIFSATTSPEQIEDLIRYADINQKKWKNKKVHLKIKQLGAYASDWFILMKDIIQSGSTHLIISIENQNITEFLKIVSEQKF